MTAPRVTPAAYETSYRSGPKEWAPGSRCAGEDPEKYDPDKWVLNSPGNGFTNDEISTALLCLGCPNLDVCHQDAEADPSRARGTIRAAVAYTTASRRHPLQFCANPRCDRPFFSAGDHDKWCRRPGCRVHAAAARKATVNTEQLKDTA